MYPKWGLLELLIMEINSGLTLVGEADLDDIISGSGLAVMATKESLIHHWI